MACLGDFARIQLHAPGDTFRLFQLLKYTCIVYLITGIGTSLLAIFFLLLLFTSGKHLVLLLSEHMGSEMLWFCHSFAEILTVIVGIGMEHAASSESSSKNMLRKVINTQSND